ncbi:unnamed protein product [Musa acuminata subsp. burmannicoides]
MRIQWPSWFGSYDDDNVLNLPSDMPYPTFYVATQPPTFWGLPFVAHPADMPYPIFYVATQPATFWGLPFVAHPAVPLAMVISAVEPQRANLLKQIDYYFRSDKQQAAKHSCWICCSCHL